MEKFYQDSGINNSSWRAGRRELFSVFTFLILVITVTSCAKDSEVLPRLNTITATDADINSTSAILKGEFLSVGNMKILEYGFEYSRSIYFTTPQTKVLTTTPVTGTFQIELTNLEPKTTYYYKAFALINTANVYSQNYSQFTTK